MQIMNKASAFNVLSDLVLVLNTVSIAEIVRSLHARGSVVKRDDLARQSPLARAHVVAGGSCPNKNAGSGG